MSRRRRGHGGARSASRKQRESRPAAPAPAKVRPGNARPQLRGFGAHLRGERPLNLHCVVVARYRFRRILAAMVIVDHIDAADKRDRAVDARELAMHAPQPAALLPERPGAHGGTEHQQFGLRPGQPLAKVRREVLRAEAVDQQVRGDAALCRARERFGDQAAGRIVGIDVGFDEHLRARRVDRGDQRGKILPAIAQQRDAVAADVVKHARVPCSPRDGPRAATRAGRDARRNEAP